MTNADNNSIIILLEAKEKGKAYANSHIHLDMAGVACYNDRTGWDIDYLQIIRTEMKKMMHYSQQKDYKIAELKQHTLNAREAIIRFRNHLLGSKFHVDPTIQVADVQRWLDGIDEEIR